MKTDSFIQDTKALLRQGIGLEHAAFRLVNPPDSTMLWEKPNLKAVLPDVDHYGMRKLRVFDNLEELMNDRLRLGKSVVGHYSVYNVSARGLIETSLEDAARWRLLGSNESAIEVFHAADVYVMKHAVGKAPGDEVLQLDLDVSPTSSVRLQKADRVMDPRKWSAALYCKTSKNGRKGVTVISIRPDEEIARGQARRSYSALSTAFDNRPPSLDWVRE